MLIFKRNFLEKVTLTLNVACFGAAQTFLFALLPILRERTNLSLSTLILGLSLGTLCFLPGTYFWNKKSDEGKTFSSLRWNSFFLFCSVLTIFLLITTNVFPLVVFLFGRICWGLGASGTNGLTLHYQIQHQEKKLKGITNNSFALNLGRMLGPVLVLMPFSIEEVVTLFSLVTFVNFILNLFLRKDSIRETKHSSTSWTLSPALSIVFIMALTTGLIHAGLGEFIRVKFSLEGKAASEFTGSLLLAGSIVMLLGLLAGKQVKDQDWKKLIFTGTFLMVPGLLLFNFISTREFLYYAVALICLGVSLLNPGAIMLMTKVSSEHTQGKSLGLMSTMTTLGSAAGGVLLSFSLNHFEYVITGLALVLSLTSYKILVHNDTREVLWKA